MLKAILEEKNMSMYKLEKVSNLSHATLSDLANEKTKPENCSSFLLNEIAKALHISMDELYKRLTYQNMESLTFNKNFDLFKSNVNHEYRRLKLKEFLEKYLLTSIIEDLYEQKEYDKALYLVSTIDYLCKKNDLPIPAKFDYIRKYKLDKVNVPESIYRILETRQMTLNEVYKKSIPEFLKHNIVEAEIENIV